MNRQLKYPQPFIRTQTPQIPTFPEFPFPPALATGRGERGIDTNTQRTASRSDHRCPHEITIYTPRITLLTGVTWERAKLSWAVVYPSCMAQNTASEISNLAHSWKASELLTGTRFCFLRKLPMSSLMHPLQLVYLMRAHYLSRLLVVWFPKPTTNRKDHDADSTVDSWAPPPRPVEAGPLGTGLNYWHFMWVLQVIPCIIGLGTIDKRGNLMLRE